MKQKAIANIIHLYFLRLKKHFAAIRKNITAETIKPFRIEIKKLRAFLRLLSFEKKDPGILELHGDLKKMHKTGGRFRDLQLHRQRVLDAMKKKGNSFYSDQLLKTGSTEIKKEKKHFLAGDSFSKTEKKIKEHLPEEYTTRTIKEFFRSRLEIIQEIIRAARFSDKEMHTIRKQLKDILYILKLYSVELKKSLGFRFWTRTELGKVKAIEDQLGFLNDSRNALALLQPTDIKGYDGEDKKLLRQVRSKLVREKRKLKKELLASLDKIPLEKP